MKTLAALILAAFAASSIAAEPCALPLPKIIGSDYHTARANLIKHGCFPVAYNVSDEGGRPAPEDAAMLGYIEANHSGSHGGRNTQWRGFSVHVISCEDFSNFTRKKDCAIDSVTFNSPEPIPRPTKQKRP